MEKLVVVAACDKTRVRVVGNGLQTYPIRQAGVLFALNSALLLDPDHARRIPIGGAAVGIQKTHFRGAGVARGVEGIPDLAGAVAADRRAGHIPTNRQDLIDTVIVPFKGAAVGIEVTDGVDAGITSRIQVYSDIADVVGTRWLRLGRGGPGQPAQTDRDQQPVEAGQRAPSFGSRAK
jgi:hypothetical protein